MATSPTTLPLMMYDLSLNVRTSWQAHSLSTAGTNGSNKVMPRQQLLADGSITDACSGNIAKHHHAMLLAEYLEAAGVPLCPACAQRDGRRAAALVERPEYKNLSISRILSQCGLCDAHGFLVTAKKTTTKNTTGEQEMEIRQRQSKHSLVEFSFALALPGRHAESTQVMTRNGDSKDEGQMLMKMTTRSGEYALIIRYHAVGVGVDTDRWQVVVDEKQRQVRQVAILEGLRDALLSPDGAMTACMLPHLTGLVGAIVVRTKVGRAPMYSALNDDFIDRLLGMKSASCLVYSFVGVDSFNKQMQYLIDCSTPCLPRSATSPQPLQDGMNKR